tara:strand:+ start:3547 stop:4122 length:576 start_codon:yes stop_codon:yes gene_type:complete
MATDANSAIRAGTIGVGLHNVGSYQASGTPWITGSVLKAEMNSGSIATYAFPRVASSITIQAVPDTTFGNTSGSTDTMFIFFGESKTSAGTLKVGENCFNNDPTDGAFSVDATMRPNAISQGHVYCLYYMTGSNSSGGSFTTNVKTDHINIACGAGAIAVTASYQIFAELTNIPAARMPVDYISGSGVNTI